MAIAKQGTRLIWVDQIAYRWLVRSNAGHCLVIVVEYANDPGQRMVTWVNDGTVISPWLVKAAIQHALKKGWHPQQRGTEFAIRVYGMLENLEDWAKAAKGSPMDTINLNDWNPSPANLRRWAYDERAYLEGCEESLVLHQSKYLSILIPIAADIQCPKAGYILEAIDDYLRCKVLSQKDTELEALKAAIAIADPLKSPELVDWVARLKRQLAYCSGIGPINTTTALKMGKDLLLGLRSWAKIIIVSETEAQIEIGFSTQHRPLSRERLHIDKTSGQFAYEPSTSLALVATQWQF